LQENVCCESDSAVNKRTRINQDTVHINSLFGRPVMIDTPRKHVRVAEKGLKMKTGQVWDVSPHNKFRVKCGFVRTSISKLGPGFFF
jgi:hypothetical protein